MVEFGEETLWFFAYDVSSENIRGIDEETKNWLRSKRVQIWYELRFHYKCVPVQQSLWLIRDMNTKEKLEKRAKEWLKEYEDKGLKALIQIFPIKTTEEGYKTFKEWEFSFLLEWLGSIEKSLSKAINERRISRNNYDMHRKKLELIESILNEDFGKDWDGFELAQDTVQIVYDLLLEAQQYIS